ncbi:hypothetical protein H1P_1330004 [Hyella patelloides LEGE 07179]|uniref:Uncharacterized protein n=1 Tax=Hyella patelloides LEGE 07179 TaxID=945734 RepID=A0A563VL99_9CYAN|nr:hypothetical protein H1P_1330004 [Hyella patelloides LEGE 07179]
MGVSDFSGIGLESAIAFFWGNNNGSASGRNCITESSFYIDSTMWNAL